MMYLYFDYYLAFINKDKENTNLYLKLIGKLYNARNKFLIENNLSVVDESPFKDFTFKCFGLQTDPKRVGMLKRLAKKEKNKQIVYRYVPTGKIGTAPAFVFNNTSGNQITNKKYFIIKK